MAWPIRCFMTSKSSVHIYKLSRLVHAAAGSWEKRLQEIEQGRRQAYVYYRPMREAVVAFCASKGNDRDKIVKHMLAQAQLQPWARGQNPETDNLEAFETFEEMCYPKIGTFMGSLLRRPQGLGVSFAGVLLYGTPHFKATDRKGVERFVFLYASKWRDDDLKAYLELLGVVVEAEFRQPATSLWHMDLRKGLAHKHRPSKRTRQVRRRSTSLHPGLRRGVRLYKKDTF